MPGHSVLSAQLLHLSFINPPKNHLIFPCLSAQSIVFQHAALRETQLFSSVALLNLEASSICKPLQLFFATPSIFLPPAISPAAFLNPITSFCFS